MIAPYQFRFRMGCTWSWMGTYSSMVNKWEREMRNNCHYYTWPSVRLRCISVRRNGEGFFSRTSFCPVLNCEHERHAMAMMDVRLSTWSINRRVELWRRWNYCTFLSPRWFCFVSHGLFGPHVIITYKWKSVTIITRLGSTDLRTLLKCCC